MNNYKIRSGGRIIPIIMLALMMILSTPTSVLALNEAPVTEVKATDLSDALDYDWKVSTNGSVLTIEVRDARAGVPGAANWSAIGYLTGSPFVREKFTGTTCTMTYDFSQYKDGIKTLSVIVFVEGATTDTTMWSRDIFLKISGGQVSIYNPYGQSAVDFLNKLNAERNPADYSNPASIYMLSEAATSYEEIVALAKELTAGKTDAEKVLAIHDWICTNCAYDKTDALSVNVVQDMYKNRYGVCEHFAQLTTLMCRAAGVPCITIHGIGTGCLEEGDDKKADDHAWNAVYYNNSWHFIDNTWDCANRYYGAGNSKNTRDKKTGYKYFDLPAAAFGASHYATNILDDAVVPKGIVVKNGPRVYIVGQPFSTEYEVCYEQYGGDTSFLAAKYDQAEFSGYDSSKEGEQTITVKYGGFTTRFTVNVYKKNGIKAVAKEGSGANVSGYDINKAGKQKVTVTYDGFTTTFEINVEGAAVAYDRIVANPISGYTYLRGENFTPQYKLFGIKGSKQEEIKDLSEAKLTFDNTKIRSTVTVEYGDLTTTFDVATIDPTGISYIPSSTTFNVGDEFKVKGVLKYKTSTGNKEAKDPEAGKISFSGYDMSKAGKQTVTVTYKVYSKTYKTTFDITVKDDGTKKTAAFKVSLAKTSYTYTGKDIKPAVTVVDADGKKLGSSDYSAVYSDNKSVGTAKVTITFKGAYASNAQVVETFAINPKGTTISKVTPKSKKLVVGIKAQKKQTTGYEVRYSLKKNMSGAKTVKITRNSTTSATISKLQGKKTYYVQIRTYKTVSGKTYYSGWSKTVAKTTLK